MELRDATVVYPGGNVGLDGASRGDRPRASSPSWSAPPAAESRTFIRLLLREIEPARGQVLIAGRDIGELPRKKMPKLRRNIGVVFQDFKLLPNRTVYDNVAYSLQVIGESRSNIRAKVPEILRLVGLSTKLNDYPDELSGGEQQRVSLARAFVNQPAAAAGGRADRQPRPRDLDRDHAAALPDEPHRHDRDRRHARQRDGGPHAPPRDRAERGPRSCATSAGGDVPGERRQPMRPFFFLREALRALRRNAAPSLAAFATILITTLVLGVFIPVVRAATAKTNEVRNKIELEVFINDDATRAEVASSGT